MSRKTTVESIHPLSPLQQGMLFHALYTPDDDVYVEQVSCRFDGELDAELFQQAWQQVVERHPALRASFHATAGSQPVQMVHAGATVPWTVQDWRDVAEDVQHKRLDAFLDQDRTRGFDPAVPPLQRFALIRLAENAHQFVWTHHHLLLDGWSVPLVLRDLTWCYAALRQGRSEVLPAVRPYQDYIDWLARQPDPESFWRPYLSGFTAPTPLPLGQDPIGAGAPCRRSQGCELPEEATARLAALAPEHGITLGTLVQAAWALVLSRYSGLPDVMYGATVSGRPPDLPGVADIVGLFINTLPVRVRVEPHRPVLAWLREVQGRLLTLRGHEHTSLVQAQGWSDVPRGTPMFDSLVVFENYPSLDGDSTDFTGVTVGRVRSTEETSFPLTVVAIPGERLRVRLLYDARRHTAGDARALLSALGTALDGLAADPGREVCQVPLQPERDRADLVARWNGTSTEYPADVSLSALFDAQAARTPHAVAVVHGERQMGYAALADRAARVTSALRALGIRPGQRVGLCLDRSPEYVAGVLGIVRAGAAYVPLDPAYPADRLGFMVDDSQVEVVLTTSAHSGALPAGVRTVCLDTLTSRPGGEAAAPAEVGGDTLAYVMYTSGSTGTPKGVAVPHRAVARLVCSTDYVRLLADDRMAFGSNTAFDATTFEIWGPLLNGAALVVVDARQALDPPAHAAFLRERALTTLFMTTALLNQFAAAAPDAFATMRHVLFGGEAVDPEAVRAVLGAGPPRRLLHVYGPTESTTFATWHLVEGVPEQGRTVPIGRALANTTAYVLDEAGQPAPPGCAGELFLGGDGLAHGYWGRAALTAERFVPDPYRGIPGARLYRTGDLVRSGADGALVFLGRNDQQTKLRGFRIECGEVEAALRAFPSVSEAVVTVREDEPGDRRLVAYVVGGDIRVADLRAHCAKHLPGFMVPAAFVPLPHLPLTPNGKTDHRALPAPGTGREHDATAFSRPRPGTEELLAELWTQVLNVDRVARDDNFFALGGHSLSATQLQTRLRRTLGAQVPLRAVFEAGSLAELAAELDRLRREGDGTPAAFVPPPRPVDRGPSAPLALSQRRLWFLEQLDPGTALYHISGAVRLRGPLDVAALRAAWQAVVDRHEVLRSHVLPGGASEPRQAVVTGLRAAVPLVDVSGPSSRSAPLVRALVRRALDTPFDLTRGPLWRLVLLRTGPEEHVLAVCLHHLIADGESMDLLLAELGTQYRAGGKAPLPELPLQYGDFAHWQRTVLDGGPLADDLAYWRKQLAGLTGTTLPTDRPRSDEAALDAARVRVDLPSDQDGRLAQLCRQAGVTVFMALLTAFAVALGQDRGLGEVVVGTPTANRTHEDLEGLIGFFVNTLVLRLDLGEDPTFRQVLDRTREVCLGAYAHQAVPFDQVVAELAPEREAGRLPFFQTWFVVQDAPSVAEAFPGVHVESAAEADRLARYDLRLDVQRSPEETRAVFEYRAALFDQASVTALADRFTRVLDQVTADPHLRLTVLAGRLAEAEEQTRRARRDNVSLSSLHRLRNTRRRPVRETDRAPRDQGDRA